jgi:hypothetical protein
MRNRDTRRLLPRNRSATKKEIGTMSAKILPALVVGLLLGTTGLASAQALVAPYYGYYTYAPAYSPVIPLGIGAPGVYYTPGYYNYAPAYAAPGYAPAYVAPSYAPAYVSPGYSAEWADW